MLYLVEVHELVNSYKRRVEALRYVHAAIGSIDVAAKNVSRLSTSSRIGDRLIKGGVALVLFPEPILSEILGTLLIGAGILIKRRFSGETLNNLGKEFGQSYFQLKKLLEEIG